MMKMLRATGVIALVFVSSQMIAKAGFVAETILSGDNERPISHPGLASSGLAIITYNEILHTLSYDITYHNLTSNAAAAHIHVGPMTAAGPVILPFNPSPTGTDGELTGTLTDASITNSATTGLFTIDQVAAQIEAGNTYVNIHTTNFPGGEIRGQLAVTETTAVPEPATLVSLGLGALAFIGGWRRMVRSANN